MSEERSGLSSAGEQRMQALELQVEAIARQYDPSILARARADIAVERAEAAKPPPDLTVDVDELIRVNAELARRSSELADRLRAAEANAAPAPATVGVASGEPAAGVSSPAPVND